MTLAAGSRVGPYEILSPLGAGAMGEVYRARDARLGRDVAVKILADSFVHDPDRIARLHREAQALAALNHPHIAQIYGLEDMGGGLALVMELVEGETLADRIARAPIPLDEALPIARQIADALEVAHEHGIIHRDLKPANISITADGTVKVLDFGLAKLTGPADGRGDATMSPTITSPALMTGVGLLLGTAAYMSPEQARGKVADRRSDVWAFGCVLFEMITGRRAFPAEEVSDTLATVLMKEPDWSLLPAATPSSIRTLLRRSLEKDRKRRLPDIGSARLEVDEAMSAPSSPTMVPQAQQALASAARGQRLAWSAAALAIMAAVAIGARHLTERPPEPPPSVRLPVAPPPNDSYPINVGSGTSMALSPDGRKLVFEVVSQGGRPTLALRFLDRDDAQELPGAEDAQNPFWSPDSRFIGFFTADGKVKRIDVGGGPPQIVCDLPRSPRTSGTWNRDGVILLAANAGPLLQVPAGGGMPSPVTALDATRHEIAHLSPWFLPDGRHFLYTAWTSAGSSTSASIFVGALGDSTKIEVGTSDSKALYGNGYLLYGRQGTVLAQRFDADRFVTTGDAAVVSDDIYSVPGASAFHLSARGELAFRTGQTTEQTQLTIVDRAGKQLATIGEPAEQTALALSPDGSRVALSVLDAGKQTRDLWIRDLKRKLSTRFTFNAGDDWTSAWSPDGSKLAFSGGRPGPLEVLQQPADGSGAEERLTSGPANEYVSSWSPDGRFILFYLGSAASTTSNDVWVLPTFGDRTPKPFLQGPFAEADGQFSPDGRWVAYRSNESGQAEVYVVPFPGPGGKWQVSNGGGFLPRWRADGKEIFYATPGNKGLVAVPIDASGTAVDIGAPTHLFDARLRTSVYRGYNTGPVYDVFPDGQRFLLDVAVDDRAAPPPIRVITNWTSTLH